MEHLRGFFDRYDRLLVFDTETTGLHFESDDIIQFSAVTVGLRDGTPAITGDYNELIALAPGFSVPPEITRLTGITNEALRENGIPRDSACHEIGSLIGGNTLLVAYNAHFDLSFLYHMLRRCGDPGVLAGKDKLDLLTVYRDRRSYPHKLCNAIEAYDLSGKVCNSHSAEEDALAAAWVMDAMAAERDDLMSYVNLFGYIPKYGPPPRRIRSVRYLPQPYDPPAPLYMGPVNV